MGCKLLLLLTLHHFALFVGIGRKVNAFRPYSRIRICSAPPPAPTFCQSDWLIITGSYRTSAPLASSSPPNLGSFGRLSTAGPFGPEHGVSRRVRGKSEKSDQNAPENSDSPGLGQTDFFLFGWRHLVFHDTFPSRDARKRGDFSFLSGRKGVRHG